MRRGIWVGAAVLVAVAAAIPLWLTIDDDDGRRAAALAAESDCSQAEDVEACSALARQLDEALAAYGVLEKQLAATAEKVHSWQAMAEVGTESAPEAMAEVGTAVVTLDRQVDEVRAELLEWEEKLNTVGDDAQLANVDLQNMLQKQAQTLQMMSNISKALHDTAQAVIRNVKS